ncbi:hypothetical protein [Streptomyces mayteni]
MDALGILRTRLAARPAAGLYRACFSTTYDRDFASYGVWRDGELTVGATHAEKSTDDVGVDYRHDTGAWLTFADGARVTARTGLSFVSVESAAENRDSEVGRGRHLPGVRDPADGARPGADG